MVCRVLGIGLLFSLEGGGLPLPLGSRLIRLPVGGHPHDACSRGLGWVGLDHPRQVEPELGLVYFSAIYPKNMGICKDLVFI
jgi:hypothetical protein